jgi:hypothetical protein
MPDMFATMSVWLTDQRDTHFAHDVTYSRGASSATLRATVSDWDASYSTDEGQWVESKMRAFVFVTTALEFAGVPFVPLPGDRITDVVGVKTLVYAVASSPGGVEYEYTTMDRSSCMVFAKLVSET